MNDNSCAFFAGRCDDVCCNNCPNKPTAFIPQSTSCGCSRANACKIPKFGCLNYDPDKASVFDHPPRSTPIHEGGPWDAVPVNSCGTLDPDDTALFMPDAIMHPPHYARWKMEPIEFIAINNLPWWLANLIKYTMRYDAKDGLKDLYKGRSYLEMKIREVEGELRFWDKPVADERKLNGDHANASAA